MCKVICVTALSLAPDSAEERLLKICGGGIDRVILREKSLSENEYTELARKAAEICGRHNVPFSPHSFIGTARSIGSKSIHLPYGAFANGAGSSFDVVGVSVHSVEEAVFCEKMGASYITAGHIFATDCKKGLAPRGTAFLRQVCESVSIPVYAIGGITSANAAECVDAGASGICIMSALMKSECPEDLISRMKMVMGR